MRVPRGTQRQGPKSHTPSIWWYQCCRPQQGWPPSTRKWPHTFEAVKGFSANYVLQDRLNTYHIWTKYILAKFPTELVIFNSLDPALSPPNPKYLRLHAAAFGAMAAHFGAMAVRWS
ncbi:hypothetical protein DFP72DRAFT_842361 [Ephemerocybe angulata]|uniref:Uncharacterized protein n=1 Tax=Ephemerocybe angulata TaxID=980116 RepID=A0A8H6MDU2_9AGAR|nr:hypothetical protein DFP72DRAFT_842361 [Tulosesus angulatus]